MTVHYSRELVERLIPTLWDRGAVLGMTDPRAPEQGMPRGHVDKKKGSSLFAHLVDIRQAWETTELTLLERRTLFMRYGLDWTHSLIAHEEGVSRQAISRRDDTAVGKLTARLNDEEYIDGYDGLAELVGEAS